MARPQQRDPEIDLGHVPADVLLDTPPPMPSSPVPGVNLPSVLEAGLSKQSTLRFQVQLRALQLDQLLTAGVITPLEYRGEMLRLITALRQANDDLHRVTNTLPLSALSFVGQRPAR